MELPPDPADDPGVINQAVKRPTGSVNFMLEATLALTNKKTDAVFPIKAVVPFGPYTHETGRSLCPN